MDKLMEPLQRLVEGFGRVQLNKTQEELYADFYCEIKDKYPDKYKAVYKYIEKCCLYDLEKLPTISQLRKYKMAALSAIIDKDKENSHIKGCSKCCNGLIRIHKLYVNLEEYPKENAAVDYVPPKIFWKMVLQKDGKIKYAQTISAKCTCEAGQESTYPAKPITDYFEDEIIEDYF